jgi:hypothetical protein
MCFWAEFEENNYKNKNNSRSPMGDDNKKSKGKTEIIVRADTAANAGS